MPFEKFLEHWGWIVAIGAIAVAALLLHFLIQVVGHALFRRLSRRLGAKRIVAATAPKAAVVPAICLVWGLALIFCLEISFRQWLAFDHAIPLTKARQFAVIGAVGWWLFRWKQMAQRRLHTHAKEGDLELEIAQIDLAGKLVTLGLLVFVALLVMQIAGLDMKALVTLGGFSALAVGLAGKEVFSNLFSGVMIYITKPFVIGDLISSPEKGIEGVVEKIGWYLTQLRGVDKRPAYVPNSLFSTAVVHNTTRLTNRRIEFKLGLRYRDLSAVPPIVEAIRALLGSMQGIDAQLAPTVWFTDYGASSVNIFVRAYTSGTDWFQFLERQQEVLLRCAEIVHQHQADFAFPTTTLDFPLGSNR